VENKHFNIVNLDERGMLGDEKTGLQWRESSDIDGLEYYHEAVHGELYGTVSWRDATDWVKTLSTTNPGWRLPTILELMSLFELGAPLAEVIDSNGRWWAEGRRPDAWAKGRPTDAWTKPSVPKSVSLPILYWASIRQGLLTTFWPGYPFQCGISGDHVTNVFAVRDWKPPDIRRYTPEELIEQLGFIWVVRIPAAPSFDVVDFGGGGGSRVISLSNEAKTAELMLLKLGVKAIPALLAVLTEPKLQHLPIDSSWPGFDRRLFCRITTKWGSDEAEKLWEDTRELRLRPNLVRQGALRILTQLRTDVLLSQNVAKELDDITLGIQKSAAAPPKPSFLRRLFGVYLDGS
jgi:hypothetical protein